MFAQVRAVLVQLSSYSTGLGADLRESAKPVVDLRNRGDPT